MAEEAKRIRTSAKARFTRKRNEFLKSVDENKGMEAVKRTFADLHEAWNIVEGKHDIYMIHLAEDEIEQNEAWINELQELYEEAATTHTQYVNDHTLHEQKRVEEFHKQESMRLEQEKLRRLLEQFSIKKKSMKTIFDTLVKRAYDAMASQNAPEALRKTERDLDIALADCKALHNTMLELLDNEDVEKEIEWIRNMRARHQEISSSIEAFISIKINDSKAKDKSNPLQLEKIKMPSFHGNVRNYPQFKTDFEKQVMPSINAENASYVLRSCLGKEPADTVKSVDDDIIAMWKRLDEKYGDPAKVADVVMCAIQNIKPIREGENKKFVEFINVIDDGYRDLRRLGLEKEITTTSSVSIIERKLPNDIKREWAKLVSSEHSTIDKRDKFPSLLRFLLEQKQAIEYENAELRSNSNVPVRGSLHYLEKKDDKVAFPEGQGTSRYKRNKCLYHEGANHWTNECRLYLSKPIQEGRDTLKERGACWSCLKRGHRTQDCRGKKPCGVNDCNRFHHKTLHEEEQDKKSPTNIVSVSGTASVCNNEIETCLLQIQKIPTKNGFANVLWDTGASLCFITNAKARAENLKGIKAQLSIIKVGGESETVDTFKYKLPLIDKQGKAIVFDVYGIDKITSPIPSIDIQGISKLFKDVHEEDLIRPTGEVDTLIGYEYADFHPLKEQSSGHLRSFIEKSVRTMYRWNTPSS
ncbi:uncharacterized protein [Montipora foliosa]|uniref:uncharacterized protein n=1 Tax=Montipora foliosa TaxID=591990 RepID=UPI0035F12B3D